MATVLEKYNTEGQRSLVRYLWVKEPNAKDIYEETPICSKQACFGRYQKGRVV
jgi:hypothetical protein